MLQPEDKNKESECSYQHFKCAKPLDFSFKNLNTLEGMYICKLRQGCYFRLVSKFTQKMFSL